MGEQDSAGMNHARRTDKLFWSATGTSCLLAILIGSNIGGGGSDAAGNGMEAGYAFLGALLALGAIGLLSVIFALTRVIWARYVLVALAVALSFALLLAVVFSS
jgi:hypothetical protein